MFLSECITFVCTFLCCHCTTTTWKRLIHHLHISHNTLCLSPKILHSLRFSFLLGIAAVRREIENNACEKICWANKVHYGKCASGEFHVLWRTSGGGGGWGLGGRKQAKTKFSLFLNLSAVPKKSTPATNFEKSASKLPIQSNQQQEAPEVLVVIVVGL